jgi:PAS domain S-box-containing protein
MPEGRLLTLWLAEGFAIAMLLLRGSSRWPAILLGALVGSWVFPHWRWVLPEGAVVSPVLSLLNSSLESTADGLLVVDRQGRITAVNARFAELWGVPPALLKGGEDARVLAFVREQLEDPEAFMARVESLYAHPELESEDEVVLKGGRVFERVSRPQRLGAEVVGRRRRSGCATSSSPSPPTR